MGKYAPIRQFLERRSAETVPMTFAEIERVLGFKLPRSKEYPAWWSNNPKNNVMTNEWLAAGYRTEQVDVESGRLVFRRSTQPPDVGGGRKLEKLTKAGRHPIFGALKDVTWIAPGTDLTQPAYPEWADLIDDPNWGNLPE